MKRTLKGITGILLSATLFAGAVAASPAIAGASVLSTNTLTKTNENVSDGAVTYIYGDVDVNNKLEASDALAILKHVVKLSCFDDALVLTLADVDRNDAITASDALAVLKCVVKLQNPTYYTVTPTASETPMPSETVTPDVTETPAVSETPTPSESATPAETVTPTATPAPVSTETAEPTVTPTETAAPTDTPDVTDQPAATAKPTAKPAETATPAPTETAKPTVAPTETVAPTVAPTPVPTETVKPTAAPTVEPTPAPTESAEPTTEPTVEPTESPAPTECSHEWTTTYKTITIVDKEAQYDVETPYTVWVCSCNKKFYSSKGATVKDLEAHQSAISNEIDYHMNRWSLTSADHIAAGYECTYNSETHMYVCTCGWSNYTGCGASMSYIEYVYEDIPAVTHEEKAIVYVCSVCGETKEYEYSNNANTCKHEWYVAREAWSEDVEERHLFCACGYDCGLYDNSYKLTAPENAEAYANLTSHRAQYDKATILAEHRSSQSKMITVTKHHPETYRCALCGKYKDTE